MCLPTVSGVLGHIRVCDSVFGRVFLSPFVSAVECMVDCGHRSLHVVVGERNR